MHLCLCVAWENDPLYQKEKDKNKIIFKYFLLPQKRDEHLSG